MTNDSCPKEAEVLSGPDLIVLNAVSRRGPFARAGHRLGVRPAKVGFVNATSSVQSLIRMEMEPVRHGETGTVAPFSFLVTAERRELAAGEAVVVTVSGEGPERPGSYRSSLRLVLSGGTTLVPVEIRVSAYPAWGMGCLLLGLFMVSLGSLMDAGFGLRRQLHDALQLKQEMHELVEQVPAPLVATLPIDAFDREIAQAIDLLGQNRRWSFLDRRQADATPHLEAARGLAEKLRTTAAGGAPGRADSGSLEQQWAELHQTFEAVGKLFPAYKQEDDSFGSRLTAFNAWTAQRILLPSLSFFEGQFSYDVARVRLLYEGEREAEAANLAGTLRRAMRRSADMVREQAGLVVFFQQTALDNFAAEQRLRRHLANPALPVERREAIARSLDEAVGLLRPPFDWATRREVNRRIEKLATAVDALEAEVVLAAATGAAAQEEREDSTAVVQTVTAQGATLPRGPDGKIEPEAKFAWLGRLAAAWRECLAGYPEKNPPALMVALEAFEHAVASRDLEAVSVAQKNLWTAWQTYSTERALRMVVQATAAYNRSLKEDVLAMLDSLRGRMHDLASHEQQEQWEQQWAALKMKTTAFPETAEQMNNRSFEEIYLLYAAVVSLSNRVDDARWERVERLPATKPWLAGESGAALAAATLKTLPADPRILSVITVTPADDQVAGREIRFRINNLDPVWTNGVEVTLDFGDGTTQVLTAEDLGRGRTFSHLYNKKGDYALSAWAAACEAADAPGRGTVKLGATPQNERLHIRPSPVTEAEFWADAIFNLRYGLGLVIAVALYYWRFKARTQVFGASTLDYAQAFTLGFAASLAVNAPAAIVGLFM